MILLQEYRYCFVAGAFAAGGSFFGKLPGILTFLSFEHFYLNTVLLQLLPLALMIFCNVMNWRYFVKSLQICEQTLTATVLTAATNFMLSFLLGSVFYGESFTTLSTFGAIFILGGLWFLSSSESEETKKHQ